MELHFFCQWSLNNTVLCFCYFFNLEGIFWWGDDQTGASEENSLFFNAYNGKLIVPLDAAPRWYLLNQVNGLRIDFHNAQACQSFSIENMSLNKRI